MKFAFVALMMVLLSERVCAKELFSARCRPALLKGDFLWRVEETKRGLSVRYSDPKKKFSTEISGADADGLRLRIAALRLSQRDVEVLRASEVRVPATKKEEETIALRPFDGVTYYFYFADSAGPREVSIDNPDFDFKYHGAFEETRRVREVIALLDHITRIAKKEKEANQAPEPTAPSGRGSSSLRVSV